MTIPGRSTTRRARAPLMVAILLALAPLLTLTAGPASAQYFGRNKIQYQDFDFQVLTTEKFDIYFYPEEEAMANDAGRMAERWYARYKALFEHDLTKRQPLILYANHADFQQTNVVSSLISEGTGGFTEGLKNRIVLPLTGVLADNDHVIGHELVHAFQYDLMRRNSSRYFSGGQMPLWFIEGMAEYLSLGRQGGLTDMWLRDAVLNEDIPSLDDLAHDTRYFPYRFGHAVWSFLASWKGDQVVHRLFLAVLNRGWGNAFKSLFELSQDEVSDRWVADVKKKYGPPLADLTPPAQVGRPLVTEGLGLNLSPAVSPDGRLVAFLSQQDIFSLGLYLADAETGKILAKLASSETDAHFDALAFTEAAGAWSPDGRQLAFVVFADGNNAIALFDAESRRVERTIELKQVDAMMQLAWSPDGHTLAFSGTEGGVSNLYLYDLEARHLRRLTDDPHAEIHPAWSPDGQRLAFVTDSGPGTDLDILSYGPFRIGILDLASGQTEWVDLPGAKKVISPQFSPDGGSLYLVADPDGIYDLYRYDLATGRVQRLTRVATGISGLTPLSPALSIASQTGRLVFSVFNKRKYELHVLDPDTTVGAPVSLPEAEAPVAELPGAEESSRVDTYLRRPRAGLPPEMEFPVKDYSASLGLVYAGQTSIGVGIDRFGTMIGGGSSLLFSDMLGNHMLLAAVSSAGRVEDTGGQVYYQNRSHRTNWGFGAGHFPYLTAAYGVAQDTLQTSGGPVPVLRQDLYLERIFVERGSLMAEYPLSENRRFEVTTGYTRYGYDYSVQSIYVRDNVIVASEDRNLDAPPAINLWQSSLAYVGDYSFFGFTSPIRGSRFRFEVEPTLGTLDYMTFLADYRKYWFLSPLTLALRGIHIGRYFGDAENDRLSDYYLGYDTLVRGYDVNTFDLNECSDLGNPAGCHEINRLIGSRLGIMNLELRLPLFGTEQFGLINFPYLPTELVAFADAGVAWSRGEAVKFTFARESSERIPVFSTGFAARFNLFGYIVLQPYLAFPYQRPEKSHVWGLVLAPGW